MGDPPPALGIDVGGTTSIYGLIERDGTIRAEITHPTRSDIGGEAFIDGIAARANELAARTSLNRMVAVGIGVPGTVSGDERTALDCPNLTCLDGLPVADMLEDRLGVPVWMQNDAYVAGLAELRHGAARDHENMVLFTLGTGVGGGIAIDNQMHRGPRQIMGELGHIIILPDGPVCSCGARGCLEVLCGKEGIVNRAWRRLEDHPDSMLAEACGQKKENISPKMIAEICAAGDEVCCDLLRETGRFLGIGMASAIVCLDPDVIVVGGGVSGAGGVLMDAIHKTVGAYARISNFDPKNVVYAELGWRAGIVGAAALAWEHVDKQATAT
ncbi:MAG: ROK family protein [Armatimonadota bacterium]